MENRRARLDGLGILCTRHRAILSGLTAYSGVTTQNRQRSGPLRPVTAQPTAGLWHALIDATSEALRRGHPHVSAEHVLYVLAANERSIAGGLLERHGVREAVRGDLDALMSSPDYLTTSSNEVLDEEGDLVGHLFLGEDGRPFFEPLGDSES